MEVKEGCNHVKKQFEGNSLNYNLLFLISLAKNVILIEELKRNPHHHHHHQKKEKKEKIKH